MKEKVEEERRKKTAAQVSARQEGKEKAVQKVQEVVKEGEEEKEVFECWIFYAVQTARVILTAKTILDIFSLSRKQVWTYSVLVENKFGRIQSWVIESMR